MATSCVEQKYNSATCGLKAVKSDSDTRLCSCITPIFDCDLLAASRGAFGS